MKWRLVEIVPEEDVRLLLSVAGRRRFARNEVVFHRDDPADSLHLVSKGRFAVRIMTPLGETATIAVRGPGDSFGEMALVGEGKRRSATVAALEEAETFAVYQDEFERLRQRHRAVDRVLIAFLAGEVQRQNALLLEALYVSVEWRVRWRLLELVEFSGDEERVVPLTQVQLAELAGASRPTVKQVLNDEQQRGTVQLRRGKIVMIDPDLLAKRARQHTTRIRLRARVDGGATARGRVSRMWTTIHCRCGSTSLGSRRPRRGRRRRRRW